MFISLRSLLNSLLGALLFITLSDAQTSPPVTYPDFPSETPAKLVPATEGFDHARREVMIPMRDGVKLHTVILVPKDAKDAPILLTRTPYNATELTSHTHSAQLGPNLND
jgi:predicted acyl esterase